MIYLSEFKPSWWLRSAHAQTIAPLLIRRRFFIETIEEVLVFPDGDLTELAWVNKPNSDTDRPIIIILHGLAGSKHSSYVKGMLQAAKRQGWTAVLMHFRGCGRQMNQRLGAYHSGETEDFRYFVKVLAERFPGAPLASVGFSIGGNVLVKYLGEQQENTPLVAGVSISAPIDLSSCAIRINQGFSKLYQHYLLQPLKRYAIEKIKRHRASFPIDEQEVQRIKTIRQFDELITAPLFKFLGADDYYQRCSGKQFLKYIKKPCLMMHSVDDPFMTSACIPANDELSSTVTYELSKKGGHLGFIEGSYPIKPKFWCEMRAIKFLKSHLEDDLAIDYSD